MSSSSNRFDLLDKDPSRSKEQETQIRITELPAEFRNQIYRYLLATDYVAKREVNPRFSAFAGGDLVFDREGRDVTITDFFRCQNVWIETSSYSLNILRVSRQIYHEALHIFSDNSWIFIRVNRTSFAQDLRSRGFNVFPIDSTQGMKVSILTISIHFLPPISSLKSDTFVMSTGDVGKLQRALSTLTGLSEMKLTFIAGPDFPKESNPITEAFSELRGVGITSVCGPGSGHSLGIMTRIISTPSISSDDDDVVIDFILDRLRNSLSKAQTHYTNQEWHETAAECEASVVYIIDCHAIYTSLTRLEDGPKWTALYGIYQNLLVWLVEAKFWIGEYDAVICYGLHVSGEFIPRNVDWAGTVGDFRRRAGAELEALGVRSKALEMYRREMDRLVGHINAPFWKMWPEWSTDVSN